MKIFNNKNIAFTLAETLITLAIIGVVTTITLQVVKNIRYMHYVSQLRKSYAIILQATEFVAQDLGIDIKNWEFTQYGENDNSKTDSILSNYDKVLKYNRTCVYPCSDIKFKNKLDNTSYKDLKGDVFNGSSFGVYYTKSRVYEMTDGSIISFRPGFRCNGVDWNMLELGGVILIGVDVNGYAKPNQLGRDLFYFVFSPNNPLLCANGYWSGTNCMPNRIIPINKNDCTKNDIGWGCAKHLIDNGWKMDY